MRALIHHSSRLAFQISRTSRKSGFSIIHSGTIRFYTASAGYVDETFALSIGHNGEVNLRVTRPVASYSQAASDSSSGPNVILYLPPGPLFQGLGENPAQEDAASLESRKELELLNADSAEYSPQHLLASATSATVVTINYRLGRPEGKNALPEKAISEQEQPPNLGETKSSPSTQPDFYKYPTPIHDTLAGFDWIQNTLNPAHLTIFGSHIGGSLALMLALTEAQSVQAVAAHEPVCDWPSLDEYCAIEDTAPETSTAIESHHNTKRSPKKKVSGSSAPADLVPLLQARERFFSSPERCFDAFASPILFLRSPGRDTPRSFPQYLIGPEYPVPTLKKTRKLTSAEQYEAPDGSLWDRDVYPDVDVEDPYDPSAPVVRRRKALSRWPPYGLDYGLSGKTWTGPEHGIGRLQVTLPWMRVFLGGGIGGSIRDETEGHKDGDSGHTVLANQGEEMVSVMRRACFWGREKGVGEKKVTLARVEGSLEEEAGAWFNSFFDGSIEED
ncbi:uncharacterized protein N7443_008901 [Penicillium atrosanguineum]|uniref:uncharacterized protein n=1 Tax=Penicillium atrosanguineum TaxID=1132637 RepID=UPI002384CBE8|nr:uncharacterized protein N7443_008901 [Penicillium atrosanguineum]KAJ5292948.1 hypothetical protein N7443_008901 [Penicillium atrosanguineum]